MRKKERKKIKGRKGKLDVQVLGMALDLEIDFRFDGRESGTPCLLCHGWPDDSRTWDFLVGVLVEKGFRCARYDLPWYGSSHDALQRGELKGYSKWGYNFDEVADALARAVERTWEGEPVLVIAHDWGAYHAEFLLDRHPEVVARCVLMDVMMGSMQPNLAILYQPFLLGVLYQYRQMFAFAIANAFPSFANYLASGSAEYMRSMAVQGAAEQHRDLCQDKNADTLALSGYPYYYWHRNFFLTMVGVTSKYNLSWFKKEDAPPVLLIFGERKPFPFHSRAIANALNEGKVGGTGSKSVGLPCGHWVQLELAARCAEVVCDWLVQTGASGWGGAGRSRI